LCKPFSGSLLPKKLQNAVIQCENHNKQHKIFCGAIPDTAKADWTMMISQWENNKYKPNPYIVGTICACLLCCGWVPDYRFYKAPVQLQAAIQLKLVAAKHASLSISEIESIQPSPSAFITSGLVEEAQ
jgi:hypothetical protein